MRVKPGFVFGSGLESLQRVDCFFGGVAGDAMQKTGLIEMRGKEGCFPGMDGFLYTLFISEYYYCMFVICREGGNEQ